MFLNLHVFFEIIIVFTDKISDYCLFLFLSFTICKINIKTVNRMIIPKTRAFGIDCDRPIKIINKPNKVRKIKKYKNEVLLMNFHR